MTRAWILPTLLVLCGSVVATGLVFRGKPGAAAALLLVLVLCVPRQYRLRLRIRLGRSARQLHWVDIWRDPAGAAAVRAANDGNETVPTVVVAGGPHVNPDPEWVRQQLSRSM
ncbi:hypothetical protein [Streptomyces mirabilis]|uniref:hypothetical protein n=1 Tax=Streptomyces mirabilis TaxID=68239 RepID=UPI0033BB1312